MCRSRVSLPNEKCLTKGSRRRVSQKVSQKGLAEKGLTEGLTEGLAEGPRRRSDLAVARPFCESFCETLL